MELQLCTRDLQVFGYMMMPCSSPPSVRVYNTFTVDMAQLGRHLHIESNT